MLPPHTVLPMPTIRQVSSSFFKMSKNCSQHPSESLVLFCGQHDKMICDSCQIESHQNCKSITSSIKAANGVKDGTAISGLEIRMNNLNQVSERMLSQIEEKQKTLKESQIKFKNRVLEIKQKLVDRLNNLEADIHKDIDSKYEQCNDTLTTKRTSLQANATSITSWKRDLKYLKQNTSEIHLFQSVKFIEKETNETDSEIRKLQKETFPTIKFLPSVLESKMDKMLPDLGTINIEEVSVPMPELNIDQEAQYLSRKSVSQKGENVPVSTTRPNSDQGGQFVVRDQRKLMLTNSFLTRKLDYGLEISGGCFIPNDRILLGHNMDKKLFVCKLDGSNSKAITLDYIPKRITLYDNNHALVSVGNDGIQVIDLTSLRPGKKIPIKGISSGIASAKEYIWIKNQRKTLIKVDINGTIQCTIKTAFDPLDICANKDGDVYYTNGETVHVVTADGKEREINKSLDLKGIEGIAVDDRGDVYVAEKTSNNIHKLFINNQKPGIVMTVDDGVYRPINLSFNNETKELLVLNNDRVSINIYRPQ
ncbi:unnamed protein product [Mytilus coruscus]|uniref:B box-type domain-containing protein n=1 Tax=Mytilus coruscus TaxID=42192 RepID=A0A6J8EUU2_MYTCO|nr:unnamed protein product [Mytilus coruscus]